MIHKGYIGFSNNKVGLLAKFIRFFTNSNISHTFIITFSQGNEIAVHEASLLVQIIPFDKYYEKDNTQSYWIYEIVGLSSVVASKALEKVFAEFAGVKYGKLQLLWFVWRWINSKFGRDIKHEKNWFTDGVICSELVYYYFKYIGLENLVKDYNPDTIQAQDILDIIKANPDLFRLVKERI